jgi:regulatory protein
VPPRLAATDASGTRPRQFPEAPTALVPKGPTCSSFDWLRTNEPKGPDSVSLPRTRQRQFPEDPTVSVPKDPTASVPKDPTASAPKDATASVPIDDVPCAMRARQPRTPSDISAAAAATAGLVLLGRRELTASQLRERLLRKGYPETAVAEAVDRLIARGLIDDARAAGARARLGVAVHRRGRARILREVKSLGVSDETARRAVAAAFDDVDEDRMIAEALRRKLRGAAIPEDPRDRQRLYGWLLRRGFESHRIQRVLKGVAKSPWDD